MYYYYWFYFPSKKGRRGRRLWRPLCNLAEYINDLTNVEAASNSGTETDSSGEEETWGGHVPPPLDLKADASADAIRQDIRDLRRIIRRQDEVLEEMRLRTLQIQEATAQRRAELQQLRAARARREAAAAEAAAAEASTSNHENGSTEAADAQNVQDAESVEVGAGGKAKEGQEFDNTKNE